MSIATVSSTAYALSPYPVGQPRPAEQSPDFDAAGRSENQAALSANNARTPSDLQAVRFRERLDTAETNSEQPPANPGTATGVLGGSLTQDQQDTLNSLSSLLETDAQSLRNDLQNGSTLSDLAQQAGLNARAVATLSQDGLMFDASV